MDKVAEALIFLTQLTGVGIVKQNKVYVPFLKEDFDDESLSEFVLFHEQKITPAELKFAWNYAKRISESVGEDVSVHTITVFDELYPKQFMDLDNKKPLLLFAKGNIDALQYGTLGVIGTRNPSERSVNVERIMVQQAIEWTNSAIVSGLALGCDYVAHRATLDAKGVTIAVLPCGFNHISPPNHTYLANEIVKTGGCLLSEYEPGLYADKYMFVRRDTLVAGLSQKLFVVECGLNSGTMYTVKDASKLGRQIGCMNLVDMKFEGNENIMTEYGAQGVTNYGDWKSFLGFNGV